jgi:hypothetical protein
MPTQTLMEFIGDDHAVYPGYFVWLDGVEISDRVKRMVASPFPCTDAYGVCEVFTDEPMATGETWDEIVPQLIASIEQGRTTSGVTEWRGGLIRWDYR